MKTNRTLKLITLTAAIFGFAATSFAQNQASATAASSAYIFTPLTIEKGNDLDFGNIASGSTESVISVDPSLAGTRNVESGDAMLPSTTGDFSAASFTITGETNSSITIEVPAEAEEVTLTNTVAGTTLVVSDFTHSVSGSTTLTGGTMTVYVGGSITVPSGTKGGTYSNNSAIEVTVNYN